MAMLKRPSRPQQNQPRSELAEALSACRGAFVAVGAFSGMSNVLMLTGAMFMLEVYDRVLPSRSVPTLVVLLALAAGLYAAQGVLDLIRGRVLVRIGESLDQALSARVYDAVVRLALVAGDRGDGVQPLRDLENVRGFLSGLGPVALFDLPWMPIYLAVCFLFHPFIGWAALGGAMVLCSLTLLTELFTRAPMRRAAEMAKTRNALAEASRRNAEALVAMGMAERLGARWRAANQSCAEYSRIASDAGGGLGAISKVLRMVLQSGVLAVGAWLVIHQEASAGIIIAGSIVSARALAPVDLAIAHWKGFVVARQSWQRLTKLLALVPAQQAPMPLAPPSGTLTIENASVIPPGGRRPVVQDVTLTLEAGKALGIIGPTASGKSSLVRMIVGVWPAARGVVRLDGATLNQWAPEALGAHIGYLPQKVELFAGTVAQNIARFDAAAAPEAVIAAAKAAGVHDLIVNLPDGYETEIGDDGGALSAGQAQRIALARALYRDPFLVVLDEPNASLDAEGDEALTQAILGVRARGSIVVVVAHRPSAIAGVDLLLVMNRGRVQHLGPKDEVLAKALTRPTLVPRQFKVVTEPGG
jgi:ATP-binding cassette subfamily C protein